MAKNLMIQGTMSGAGKSILTAGLLRVLKQDGYRAAPFKSQNMALNSFVTREGLEMGRAQVLQAQAAGLEPLVCMNPVLLKPTNDVGSQVIVNGEPIGNMSARDYFAYKKQLVPVILEAYRKLEKQADIIVLEGAGSPAEINLKQEDIVNMGLAKLVDAPVLLAGDIDRGGVFAQLIGTVLLLEPEERARVKGLIINKFRGDRSLLEPGIAMLEEKCGIPVTGVIPYLQLDLEEEDSLAERLNGSGYRNGCGDENGCRGGNSCGDENGCRSGNGCGDGNGCRGGNSCGDGNGCRSGNGCGDGIADESGDRSYNKNADRDRRRRGKAEGFGKEIAGAGAGRTPANGRGPGVNIVVLKVPHISNFTDFDQLDREPDVSLRYVDSPSKWGKPDAVLLPGSKNTMADLLWLRRSGLEAKLLDFARSGGTVFGICGGYQMLGRRIEDPEGVEEGGAVEGIGLLPVRTVFAAGKMRRQVSGIVYGGRAFREAGSCEETVYRGEAAAYGKDSVWAGLAGADFTGYEIHMGQTRRLEDSSGKAHSLALAGGEEDGCVYGNTAGTYVHGIFDEGSFRQRFLQAVAGRKGVALQEGGPGLSACREQQLDLLADAVREHMDMEAVYRILGLGKRK